MKKILLTLATAVCLTQDTFAKLTFINTSSVTNEIGYGVPVFTTGSSPWTNLITLAILAPGESYTASPTGFPNSTFYYTPAGAPPQYLTPDQAAQSSFSIPASAGFFSSTSFYDSDLANRPLAIVETCSKYFLPAAAFFIGAIGVLALIRWLKKTVADRSQIRRQNFPRHRWSKN